MKKPAHNPDTNEISRRRFLRDVILGAAGIVTASLLYPAIRYFLYPALRPEQPRPFVPIASIDAIPEGQPTFLTYEEHAKEGWATVTKSKGAWVLNRGGGNVTVYSPYCTHLGCPYSWNAGESRFFCPCHGGVFDIEGNVIAGPPPRPLDRLDSQIENGTLMIRQKTGIA
ncbi:MAG: ubiquinol-cytochrome c reductase iron-sulfur subunit [Chloroflexi bacterium]|nr:ubiquinol-cytochrome c reductase iron-sulfur subunit [Chloroflexota bacterium]